MSQKIPKADIEPGDPASSARCAHCQRVKAIGHFTSRNGLRAYWCLQCRRIYGAEWRASPEGQEWTRAYARRPEVIARKAAYARARKDYLYRATKARRGTILGKLKQALYSTRYRLAQAPPERKPRLAAILASLEAEIARYQEPEPSPELEAAS